MTTEENEAFRYAQLVLQHHPFSGELMDAFHAGVLHERERAAQVAERVGHDTTQQVGSGFPQAPGIWSIYREIAAAIRKGPQP